MEWIWFHPSQIKHRKTTDMKKLFLAVVGLATLGMLGIAPAEEKKEADDKKVTTYVVGMTGVT